MSTRNICFYKEDNLKTMNLPDCTYKVSSVIRKNTLYEYWIYSNFSQKSGFDIVCEKSFLKRRLK